MINLIAHVCDKVKQDIKINHQLQRFDRVRESHSLGSINFDVSSENSLIRKYCGHPPEFSQCQKNLLMEGISPKKFWNLSVFNGLSVQHEFTDFSHSFSNVFIFLNF